MFRKLAVLHRIIGFAFGPAVKELVHLSCIPFMFCKSRTPNAGILK